MHYETDLEKMMDRVKEIAQHLNVKEEMIFTLFRLGDSKRLPILRNDVTEEDLLAILLTVILLEQEEKRTPLDWKEIIVQMIQHMDDRQKECFVEEFKQASWMN